MTIQFEEIAPRPQPPAMLTLPPEEMFPENQPELSDVAEAEEIPQARHAASSTPDLGKIKRGPGRPRHVKPPELNNQKPPTIKPPSFTEWNDFLASFVFKWASRAYLAIAFRGIDWRAHLSQSEQDAIELDERQLAAISKPLAHMIYGTKFSNKYGRRVLDSIDGLQALIILVQWMARVNRVSKTLRAEIGEKNDRSSGNPSPGSSGIDVQTSEQFIEQARYNGYTGANAPGIGS